MQTTLIQPRHNNTPALRAVFRHSNWDALLVAGAFLHASLLLTVPSIPLIAIGLWWNANTVAHNFIHLPFFQSKNLNRIFSAFLTIVQGIPQELWRTRHLAHHADRAWEFQTSRTLALDCTWVACVWTTIAILNHTFFLTTYLPGWILGLFLCYLQGHFEHQNGAVSHHGSLYNFIFFNDGFHVEHHNHPARHWSCLPHCASESARISSWPAVLRALECLNLNCFEEWLLNRPALQNWMLKTHRRAIAKLLSGKPAPDRIGIVGGALFPRTALIMTQLFPHAEITIIDSSSRHIDCARPFLGQSIQWVHSSFNPLEHRGFDLLCVPLAYNGSRAAIYDNAPARRVLVHDWIWRMRGCGAAVSWFLLKRINLIER